MSATVDIETEIREGVLTVPIKAVTTRPDTSDASAESQLCVFLLEDGRAVRHNIQTGIQDNANIEVLGQLPEGAQVITGPYDLLSRGLEDGDAVQAAGGDSEAGRERGFSVSISTGG